MNLEEMDESPSKFILGDSDKCYFIRPFNLNDEIWAKNEIGEDIDHIFFNGNVDWDMFTRLLYRLILNKENFIQENVVSVDEDGVENEKPFGGYKKFQTMILTMEDKVSIITAFNNVMSKSRPANNEETDIDDKKKA